MTLLALLLSLISGSSFEALGAGQHQGPDVPQVFDLLEGSWTGHGTLFGRRAEFRMRWTLVLDGRFARLEFENAFLSASGPATAVISAIAFYPSTGPAPRQGWWFDSRGAALSLAITPADSALYVDWEGAGERGRSAYRVEGNAAVVVDSVFADGRLREFGRATYTRPAERSR